MTHLPSISAILENISQPESPLATALSILFEPSPILTSTLEPELGRTLINAPQLITYCEVIDAALTIIAHWDTYSQSQFITGHPRIGESKTLSKISAKEQCAAGRAPTPTEVLARLKHLNTCYEVKYPGLRYITFVNSRSQAAIAEEMEDLLGFEHSLSPDEPSITKLESVEYRGEEWNAELQRAIQDIGRIGRNRLIALGVE